MCRVGQYGVDLKRRMSLEHFREVLDQCKRVEMVRLNGLGESTLIPDFDAYLDELYTRFISVELITNGTASDKIYERILDRGGKLFFSWDAASKELFEVLRRPARWETCLQTLKNSCTYFGRLGQGHIGLIFTLQKTNIAHFTSVVQLAADSGVASVQMNVVKGGGTRWVDSEFSNISDQIHMAFEIAKRSTLRVFVPDQICGKRVEGATSASSGTHCSAPNDEALVRWNGDMQVCNMFNPFLIGNAFDGNFEKSRQSAFSELFSKKLNSSEGHPYCKDCVYMAEAYA